MIKTILVPLDGSELAEQVLPYASEIGRRAGAELLLLTSIQPVGIWDATTTAINWEREERLAQEYLDAQKERLQAADVKVRVKREHGEPAAGILETAESENVSLIAISTHGRSGITRWLFGSVADRVVQHSRVPLLMIRPRDGAGPSPVFEKVLVPLDGSEVAAGVLPFVEEMAKLFGASLVLYHAVPPISAYPGFETVNPQLDGQVLQEMQQQAKELLSASAREIEGRGLRATVAVSIDLAVDGILRAAKETGADVIAIGTHGRSGIGRMVLGSVANAVMRRSELPCLLVHTGGK
jgi:nucleotide-binding universal stress UspA family protein